MKNVSVPLALFLVAVLATSVRAQDRVILKTGATLTGEISSLDDKGVTIVIEGLGRVFVNRSRIERIEGRYADSETPPEKEVRPVPTPTVEPPAPTARPVDPTEVAYADIKAGQKLLLILKGEDHGTWRDSGRRIVAEIPVVGESRFQAVFAPENGVLGNEWLPREKLLRAVRIAGYPGRRLLFFHGIEIGSWVEGDLEDGTTFQGQLAAVSDQGVATVCTPRNGELDRIEIRLADLRTLRGAVRSEELQDRISKLIRGEPVALSLKDEDQEICGRVVDSDRVWIHLEVADESAEGYHVRAVLRGLPFTGVRTLPAALRSGLGGLARGGRITVHTERETATERIRQAVTGTLIDLDLDRVRLISDRGEETIVVAAIRVIEQPEPQSEQGSRAGIGESNADNVLPLLPGMSREEAERRLPGGMEGIDLLYDEDRIARIFCRPPFTGPVFGVRLGQMFAQAIQGTDLVFDTQTTSKVDGDESGTVMLSHSLKDLLVRAYVSAAGDVLAMEISPR